MQWIASGGGIGHAPIAPGTVASFVALLIGALALWVDYRLLVLLAVAACVGGLWAVHAAHAPGDPGWIVIDEFAGQWIAMLALGRVSLVGLILAFALFRVFDIVKPGPVGWADRTHGAFGVMADDIVAGLIAAAILLFARILLPNIIR
jgi:phosphatidylglycerophosphatase A